jgi:hypothetical protein
MDISTRVSISSLVESDMPSLQELFRDAGPFVRGRGASDCWLCARLFCDTCIGAKDNGQLIGALIAFRDQSRACQEIYIQDLALPFRMACSWDRGELDA